MPRRKSEKSHPWPPPPPPHAATTTTPVKNNILSSVESSNRLNDEIDGKGFQKATAASVLVDRFTFAGLSSKPAASQDDDTLKIGQGLRQNRSLEALFQAADSELQNYSARNAEPLPPTKLISEDGDAGGARVPDALGLHIQNSLTNVSIAPSFPVFRLNFHADQQTELHSLPSSLSSQGVVCIKVVNANPVGQQLLPEAGTALQAVGILPGHGLQQLQPASKPEKFSLVNRPGKHVCPYCNRFCAKPSVLQKHIRTHTGERPYPCNECGFRFKTKSNLYKHCKSRVHLTKRESESQILDCMSGADAYEGQIPGEEIEDQDDLSPEVNMEIAAADDDEPDRQESPKAVPLSSLGLKHFSCDTLQVVSTDADAPNFSATSRSLSVPESNENKVSVGLHSLLRLSDGTIYLMEKMSNGHAMLRPVLQEVALPAAIPIPHSVAVSHSRPAEPSSFSSFGAVPINAIATHGKNSDKEHQILALAAGKVQNEVSQTALLPENVGVQHIQMLQKPSLANAAAASANNKPDFNSFPMLQLNDDSVCVMEKATPALPRPVLQEATHRHLMPLAAAVSSMSSSFSRGNEINVSNKVASMQLKAGVGAVQSGKEQQCRGPEKPAIHFEGQPVLSIPSRSRHSKYLHKSSSAGVCAVPNSNIMISHRSLSVPGSHNISIAPKMAPMDPKNVTPEAVQERIAMLISQNASIIDTPMADAPRPKRVLRHNSEVATASAQKPDSSSLSAAKSLQRAKSLTPFASTSSTVLKSNPLPISAGLEAGLSVSSSPTVKTQRAEFMKSANTLSKTTSKFLLVPTDPNLQGTSLSLKSVLGQVSSYPLSINSPIQRTIPPVKAKSLELSAVSPKEMVASSYSANMSVGRTIEGDKNESETPDISGWKQFSVSQDIPMVFQLPSSATIDMPQPATTRLDGNLSPILTITKDVAERRQEFARTHLVLENGGKGQISSQMTPVKSVGPHLDDILRTNPALPVQYLVIAANADQSPAFVPVVAPAFPTFHPQVTTAFEAALQNQPVSIGIGESQMSFSGNREKTSNQQNVDRSCAPVLSSGSTFRSIPSICITPADANPAAETSESLWKIKLKGRLLMKRSLNIEKALSEERENMPKRMPDASKLASLPSNEAFQQLNSDSDILQESGFLRSRSCDAAMPLKKRRKTLTELGRGTAFGTRVEDANEANQSAELKSRPSTRRIELMKDIPSSVGFSEDAFLDQPENQEISEQHGSCGAGSVCSSIPNLLSAPATGRAFVPHFAPSIISFSTATEKRLDVIGIPQALTSNIPSFVPERCSIRPPLLSVPVTPVSQQVMMMAKPETQNEPSRNVDCDPVLSRSKTDSETDRSGETGVAATSDCSGKIDDAAAVQSGTGSVMLLLSHLYPSLNVTTTPTFCSVIKPQPMYISQDANKKLSMYSNWQVASPIGDSDTPGLSVSDMLALCQRNRTVLPHQYATSNISEPKSGVLTHSSYWNFKKELEMKSTSQEVGKSSDTRVDSGEESVSHSTDKDGSAKFSSEKCRSHDATNNSVEAKVVSCSMQDCSNARKEAKRIQICPGGYKSNEEYVYVRGRGKGKFVCELCGIRCKKPCMLMKHIRTHSDIRPHHCDVCSFGFKTKGNLSKHLKSKAHHLKCGDHENSHSHAVSTNSGDQPVDSNQSLDLNVSSSSCDVHEEEMDDDDDEDELRGCKDDNDEDKDDTDDEDDDDDADDVESFDADEGKSLTRVCLVEHLSASEVNKISENTVDQCYSLPDKGDRLRAVTDSEAAASLLDLSKGNQAVEIIGMSSSCDGPSIVSLPLSSFDPSLPYQVNLVNSNISQEGCDVASRTDVSNTLKTADFSSPVLLLTNYTNSSFQLPSPICFAVSNASMLSSIPNSRNQPWIILNPANLVQKPADFSGQPLIQEVERQDLDPGLTSAPVVPRSDCMTVSSVPPSSSASPVISPTASVAEAVTAHGNHRTHCEIIPVPGKVSGNADECVNGKYVCGICRKSYHESHQLTMHKNVHYLERPFPCSSCGVSFQNRTLLERHQRSERHACRSDDPRPFKCDPCGVAFRIHGHLAKHLRSKMHTAKCESAERENSADEGEDGETNVPFSRSESTDGTTVSDGANETCPMDAAFEAEVAESSSNESAIMTRCKDTFVSTPTQFMNSSGLPLPTGVTIMTPSGQKISLSQLQRQKQSIKDVLLTAPLQCDMCTKTFADVSLFEKHINTHIELRPYICDICDAGFTSVRLLESHMETHNKTKDHVCGVCGDSLLSKSSPQMETPVMSGVHCATQNYKKVLTASSATGNQCIASTSDTSFMACPLQILQENAAAGGGQLPTHSAVCTPASESAVPPGGVGSQLRVIPMQNIFSLSDSRVLLMKHFSGAPPWQKCVGNSVAPLNFDSVTKATSGHVIHVIESDQDPVRPSNVLVATSSPGVDAVCRSAPDDVTGLRDVRQQRLAVQAKGVEPMCRLLTVSFHVGENISSKSSISSGSARENVFVVPNP